MILCSFCNEPVRGTRNVNLHDAAVVDDHGCYVKIPAANLHVNCLENYLDQVYAYIRVCSLRGEVEEDAEDDDDGA